MRHKLYRFALSITGSVHDAEDVVQEVLEKVWKNGEKQAEQVNNWEAWCMTLTRNRAIDRKRSLQARRVEQLDGLNGVSDLNTRADQRAEWADLAEQVRRLMGQLPEMQRLTMHLRDIEEMRYDEIAATLDISLEQVKINLHRARKAIREKMLSLQTQAQPKP